MHQKKAAFISSGGGETITFVEAVQGIGNGTTGVFTASVTSTNAHDALFVLSSSYAPSSCTASSPLISDNQSSAYINQYVESVYGGGFCLKADIVLNPATGVTTITDTMTGSDRGGMVVLHFHNTIAWTGVDQVATIATQSGTVNTQNASSGGCAADCILWASGNKFSTSWTDTTHNTVELLGVGHYTLSAVNSTTLLTIASAPGSNTGVGYVVEQSPWASSPATTTHATEVAIGQVYLALVNYNSGSQNAIGASGSWILPTNGAICSQSTSSPCQAGSGGGLDAGNGGVLAGFYQLLSSTSTLQNTGTFNGSTNNYYPFPALLTAY